MSTATQSQTAEAEIRELFTNWLAAIEAGDRESVYSLYHKDVVGFDAVSQLQFRSLAEYRKQWEMGFEMSNNGMIFQAPNIEVVAEGNLGFVYFMVLCGCKMEDGTEQKGWMRGTTCFRKNGGEWKIVHDHYSVPFSMETMQPLFDLKP